MWRFNFCYWVNFPTQNLPLIIFPARTFHNTALLNYEPEPSRSLELKEKPQTNPKLKPSRTLHLHEILSKGGKTMWRFNFFCRDNFPRQNLPQHRLGDLRTRTFQKPTTPWLQIPVCADSDMFPQCITWNCKRWHHPMSKRRWVDRETCQVRTVP